MAKHPFNDLTPAQVERLALLSEECGEVVKAIGKILRHGYASSDPTIMDGPTNRRALANELGDVLAALDLLVEARDLERVYVELAQRSKRQRVGRYLHEQGPIEP